LRAEMDRLAEQVAAEEELLRRLEITKEMVSCVLAAGDDEEVGVVIDPGPNPEGGVGAASGMSRVAGVAGGLPGCRGGGGRCRPATRQAGVPGAGASDRAQASGGDADQAQAAG
jgi:hypothetical protein